MKLRWWTKKEFRILKSSIVKYTNKEIAEILGRSYGAVTLKLNKCGIKRSKRARRKHQKNTFAKGHEPWNKGLKGIHLNPATQFKKGQRSWNRKPTGHISIHYHKPTNTFYKFITVPCGKKMLLHRWRWEQKHGPIPPHHIVGFKNGKTLDCRMCNLYLMSRADNADRNRNVQKMRDGIRRAWQRGAFINSDKWVAFTIGTRDKKLRALALQSPELIELQRMKIKLKRAIRGKA